MGYIRDKISYKGHLPYLTDATRRLHHVLRPPRKPLQILDRDRRYRREAPRRQARLFERRCQQLWR